MQIDQDETLKSFLKIPESFIGRFHSDRLPVSGLFFNWRLDTSPVFVLVCSNSGDKMSITSFEEYMQLTHIHQEISYINDPNLLKFILFKKSKTSHDTLKKVRSIGSFIELNFDPSVSNLLFDYSKICKSINILKKINNPKLSKENIRNLEIAGIAPVNALNSLRLLSHPHDGYIIANRELNSLAQESGDYEHRLVFDGDCWRSMSLPLSPTVIKKLQNLKTPKSFFSNLSDAKSTGLNIKTNDIFTFSVTATYYQNNYNDQDSFLNSMIDFFDRLSLQNKPYSPIAKAWKKTLESFSMKDDFELNQILNLCSNDAKLLYKQTNNKSEILQSLIQLYEGSISTSVDNKIFMCAILHQLDAWRRPNNATDILFQNAMELEESLKHEKDRVTKSRLSINTSFLFPLTCTRDNILLPMSLIKTVNLLCQLHAEAIWTDGDFDIFTDIMEFFRIAIESKIETYKDNNHLTSLYLQILNLLSRKDQYIIRLLQDISDLFIPSINNQSIKDIGQIYKNGNKDSYRELNLESTVKSETELADKAVKLLNDHYCGIDIENHLIALIESMSTDATPPNIDKLQQDIMSILMYLNNAHKQLNITATLKLAIENKVSTACNLHSELYESWINNQDKNHDLGQTLYDISRIVIIIRRMIQLEDNNVYGSIESVNCRFFIKSSLKQTKIQTELSYDFQQNLSHQYF